MQRTQTDACRTAVFWRRALSHLPCRQTSTGQAPPPVRAANSCKLLICPKQTCLRFWAPLSHSARSCNNSALPQLEDHGVRSLPRAPLHRRFPLHQDRSTVSPVSHGPCTQQNDAFAMSQHFSKFRAHPVLAPLCAEGCRDDLPSGG